MTKYISGNVPRDRQPLELAATAHATIPPPGEATNRLPAGEHTERLPDPGEGTRRLPPPPPAVVLPPFDRLVADALSRRPHRPAVFTEHAPAPGWPDAEADTGIPQLIADYDTAVAGLLGGLDEWKTARFAALDAAGRWGPRTRALPAGPSS